MGTCHQTNSSPTLASSDRPGHWFSPAQRATQVKRITAYLLFGVVALAAGVLISLYRTPDVPAPAPVREESNISLVDYPLTGLDGGTRYLREWQGKSLLVNFWATWCGPCREEIPMLQEFRERYQDRGFEVIGVAFDEVEPVTGFRDELVIQYPLLLALEDPFSLLGSSGNEVGGLPHSVLLDGHGEVLTTHTGILTREQMEKMLQTYVLP